MRGWSVSRGAGPGEGKENGGSDKGGREERRRGKIKRVVKGHGRTYFEVNL